MNTEPRATSSADRIEPCPVCDQPVAARAAGAAGRLERGSCRGCGLQLIRDVGAAWREIRG